MPHIELTLSTFKAVAFLLFLCCGAVAFLYYRHTLPPVPPRTRFLLTSLRCVGLFLACLLIFEPLFQIIHTTVTPPTIAVLIDNTRSMQLKDNSGERSEELKQAVNTLDTQPLDGKAGQRYYLFGKNLRPLSSVAPDSITLSDDATDIAGALQQLTLNKEQDNIRAVVILTDGSVNTGENPLYAAATLALPIFTVGIGDSSHPKDVVLTKILTNELVYERTSVPVDVTVKTSGFSGQNIEVSLEYAGQVLDSKRFQASADALEHVVHLAYTPEGEGTKKFTVRTSVLPGEITDKNNRMAFVARVLKGKPAVLIIAGGPSPDLSTVKQTLVEQERFAVQSRTQKSSSGFYEGPLLPALVDSSDCLILIGFPTSTSPQSDLQLLQAAITRGGKPFLFLMSRSADMNKLKDLGTAFPVFSLSTSSAEEFVSVEPADAQKFNPLLSVGNENAEVWKRLPPVFRTHSAFRAKPEATVLGFARVQNVTLNDPLFVIRNVNNSRSIALLMYGIWRWKLMAQGDPATEDFFPVFLSNCIRWLSTRDEGRSFKVTSVKDFYVQGEPVLFTGQVYDALAQPTDKAQVEVKATKGNEVFETSLAPVGNGRYEGVLNGLPDGEYSFVASATSEGQPMGEYRGRFSLGELNLEFQDTRMDAEVLRQLAGRTGGRFFVPGTLDSLRRAVGALGSLSPREIQHTTDLELWNWTTTLAVILVIFSVEWFVRKRNGMV